MVHDDFQNLDEMRTHLNLNDLLPACHWMLYAELYKEGSGHKQSMIDVITWTCVV